MEDIHIIIIIKCFIKYEIIFLTIFIFRKKIINFFILFFFQLVIDIGCSDPQENINRMYNSNTVAPESTSYSRQEDNYVPPPYSTQAAAFCSQCGRARQDITAKFCSSCGHSFIQ